MADLFKILLAEKLGHCDSLYESVIGKKLGGYSWLSDYETTPYLYRAMPNLSHYYNREIMEEVVGGSVGWNQLCNGSSVTVQSGHKYFLKKGSAESVATSAGSAITGLTSGSDIVVDLTLALGSTIADYIYSLEQATAGSGVAWLKEHFPKMFGQYNPYDAGSIQSVSGLVSHDMVGFNQFDGEWNGATVGWRTAINFMPVIPNETYYVSLPYWNADNAYADCYDIDKSLVQELLLMGRNSTFVIPSNVRFIKPKVWNDKDLRDICINLSDASRNGQYEPYRKSSYPLDSTLTLRGIPKLDNGKLYYDGDTYGADGSVNRKYGVVDMGTLNWEASSPNVFGVDLPLALVQNDFGCITDSPYVQIARNADASNLDKVFKAVGDVGYVAYAYFVNRSVSTVEEFLPTVSGKHLVYELATPTTETAQPFTKTQLCDSGGTEEFVTSGIVSVGHKSKYAEK